MNEQDQSGAGDQPAPQQSPEQGQSPAGQAPPPPAQPPLPPYPAPQYPAAQHPALEYPSPPYPNSQYAQPSGHQPPPQQPYGFPQPPRKGLPVGAWIGIAAGALVLVAVIVIGTIFAIRAVSSVTANIARELPTTTPSPLPTPTPKDLDDHFETGGSGTLLMTGTADFAAGPWWAVEFEDGWNIDVFDVAGENRFSHPATGCQFYSYQGFGGFASTSDDDQTASEKTLENAVAGGLGLEWQATGSPNIVFDRTVLLDAYGYDEVEMLRYVSDYTVADGSARERVFLIRNFQPSDAVLLAMTDCPAAASGTGLDFLDTLMVNDMF